MFSLYCVLLISKCLLDFRFKLVYLENRVDRERVMEDIVEQMRASVLQEARHPPPSAAAPLDDAVEEEQNDHDDWRAEFKGIYRRHLPHLSVVDAQQQSAQAVRNGAEAVIRAEVDKYLSRPNMHPDGDPLIFWRENQDLYPHVS